MQVAWIALEVGLVIVGTAFVFAAVWPGRWKFFGSEVSDTNRRARRVGTGGMGLVLIVGAFIMSGAITTSRTHAQPTTAAQPTGPGAATDPGPSGETPTLVPLATVALYSCHAPSDPPAPPDGASASKDQMIVSKRETSKYNDDMNQYLDCLKTTSANLEARYRGIATAGEVNEVDALAVRLNNDAVDRLQSKVKLFNGELARYKARSAP
jgi:hypothetical protein